MAPPAFGELLRRYRDAAGLTQRELATKAGISLQAVGAYEQGTRQHPYPSTVNRLAEALQLCADERNALLAAAQSSRGRGTGPSSGHFLCNLPLPPTLLIGREQEVDVACQMLGRPDVRLLVFTGPGGVGKTRLALQVAGELAGDYADGACFVSLESVGDPDLVPSTIGRSLGIVEAGDQSPLDRVIAALRDRRMLLLLDSFERAVAGATLLADLLTACSGLRILVTSRVALHLRWEHILAVPPLSLPELTPLPFPNVLARNPAVELFLDRIQAIKPDVQLTTTNAQAVAEICHRLDGLPLAIELAAARLPEFETPQALLAALETRLPLLVGGPRDLPARQRTMRNAIAWSDALLSPDLQRLFHRLAVFAGGCTPVTAEAVCNVDGDLDVPGGLRSLVDASLLRQGAGHDDEPRFVLLDTIREYALEQLEVRREGDTVKQRHADTCLAVVKQTLQAREGSRDGRWLQSLEIEHDNFRAALRWLVERGGGELGLRLATSLSEFWYRRGYLREGRAWLAEMLASGQSVAPRLRGQALQAAGLFTWHQGDWDQATALFEEQLSLSRQLEDKEAIALSLVNLGLAVFHHGNIGRAKSLWEEGLAAFRGLGWMTRIPTVLTDLGNVAVLEGDYTRASELFEESLTLSRQQGNTWGLASAMNDLGLVALLQGRHEDARARSQQSLKLCCELGEKQAISLRLELLGAIAAAQGDGERAARLFGAAHALRERIGASLLPLYQSIYEPYRRTARASLGDAAWTRVWDEGRAMTVEEAVAYALAGDGDPSGTAPFRAQLP